MAIAIQIAQNPRDDREPDERQYQQLGYCCNIVFYLHQSCSAKIAV
jgi:hypothetical protein